MEVGYEYVIVARLKKLIVLAQPSYPSFLVEILKPQFVRQSIKRGTFMASVFANAIYYYTDSVLFENNAMDGWS